MPEYPKRLTPQMKKEVIDRRGHKSDLSGKKRNLVIHHKDRDPTNNDPRNLRVLTEQENQALRERSG